MNNLTHSELILAKQMVFINYITSEDEYGTPTYHYVNVRGDKMTEFRKALKKGNFNPEDYGQVLTSGYGEPSPELRAQMAIDYGCNHEAAIELSLEG
jgi:hypothetical protein